MKGKLPLTIGFAIVLSMLLVGTVSAYYREVGIIDTKIKTVTATDDPYIMSITANCTSWLEVLISHGIYEWEWITVTGTITCQTFGDILIGFESYITIEFVGLQRIWWISEANVTGGGSGYSWVTIRAWGTGMWSLNLRTYDIPSNYWNRNTTITITAWAGEDINSTTVKLYI